MPARPNASRTPGASRLFERAVAYVGADYHAQAVWDQYLRYLNDAKDVRGLAALYTRLLALPLRDLERYFGE